ncbi:hypothetical protein BD779DRAFT_1651255 [Infundibulicybe gibba]|nr:hypothetical protein BD779DRAFT_1651255 [Infundibulicybe gibba]
MGNTEKIRVTSGSTPIKKKASGTVPHQSTPLHGPSECVSHAIEMSNLWVGPMPTDEFLKEFLPLDAGGPEVPDVAADYFHGITTGGTESQMYTTFISSVNGDQDKPTLIPGFKLVNSSDHPDASSRPDKKIRPDILMYPSDVDASRPTQFDRTEMVIELKAKGDCDGFSDPATSAATDHVWESCSKRRQKCRGQLIAYATEATARQHRVCGFILYVGGDMARFIRHDRSGAVVSSLFNYKENPDTLVSFFWRFAHAQPGIRGIDETVRLATQAEQDIARPLLQAWKPDIECPFIVLQVPSTDGTPSLAGTPMAYREFVAWGSVADAHSLTGRATRAWPVVDTKTKRVMFLKDSWRSTLPHMEKETDTLKILNDAGVEYVPRLECGDDLPGHSTRTIEFEHASWRCRGGRITPRSHNRFVEDFVGIPLKRFKSSQQMLKVIFHAFIAHRQAFERCGILHRDISGGNIMMTGDGRGILNDWDLARHISADGCRQHDRTGTWQFMSIKLLMDPASRHELQDDLESFFWAVVYHGFRYLKLATPASGTYLQERMSSIFDSYRHLSDDSIGGGEGKIAFLSSSLLRLRLQCKPMQKWVDTILDMVKALSDYAEQQRRFTMPSDQEDSPVPSVPSVNEQQSLPREMDREDSAISSFPNGMKLRILGPYLDREGLLTPPLPNEIEAQYLVAHVDCEDPPISSHPSNTEHMDRMEPPIPDYPSSIEKHEVLKRPFEPPTYFRDHEEMDRVFQDCLHNHVWPKDDAAQDQLPSMPSASRRGSKRSLDTDSEVSASKRRQGSGRQSSSLAPISA